jgi:hypothetical protein
MRKLGTCEKRENCENAKMRKTRKLRKLQKCENAKIEKNAKMQDLGFAVAPGAHVSVSLYDVYTRFRQFYKLFKAAHIVPFE